MKPLCEKDYLLKVFQIIGTVMGLAVYIIFLTYMNTPAMWAVMVPFTLLLAYYVIDIIYWIFQPKVLVYQCDEGIVIKRKVKIDYKSIRSVDFKNHVFRSRRRCTSTPYVGTIIIKLKSGKIYRIPNAFYPMDAVNVLTHIKLQKRFK